MKLLREIESKELREQTVGAVRGTYNIIYNKLLKIKRWKKKKKRLWVFGILRVQLGIFGKLPTALGNTKTKRKMEGLFG